MHARDVCNTSNNQQTQGYTVGLGYKMMGEVFPLWQKSRGNAETSGESLQIATWFTLPTMILVKLGNITSVMKMLQTMQRS